MSNLITNSLPKKEYTIVSESCRKPKRKKHRNRYKNTSIRKKRIKKFFSSFKSDLSKSNTVKFKFNGENIMSNWYWSNYKKALEWQDKHRIAHWKACALALLEENRYLLHIINNISPGFEPKVLATHQNLCDVVEHNSKNIRQTTSMNFSGDHQNHFSSDSFGNENNAEAEDKNDYNSGDKEMSDDIEFEMSEEMMLFFEQSYKHKMHLRQMQEKELMTKAEDEVKEIQNNKLKRVTEMKILYGEGSSMITGMETAVQLSFDKYCDTKTPKYWPNIPFRL